MFLNLEKWPSVQGILFIPAVHVCLTLGLYAPGIPP